MNGPVWLRARRVRGHFAAAPPVAANPPADTSPAATVIIPNWNGGELLRHVLTALGAQTRTDFDVVVVDNGSTDGVVDVAAGGIPTRWIKLAHNEGFGCACNRGFDAARGRHLVLLNNDAVPEPDWLAELIGRAEAPPRPGDEPAGMVTSKIIDADRPGVLDNTGHLLARDGLNRGRGRGALHPRGAGDGGRFRRRVFRVR